MTHDLITVPGMYDLSAAAYHADPVAGGSLSSGGARKLLPPSCPAKFDYERRHPPAPKREFDIGHAAHLMVLGKGQDLVVIDKPDYHSPDAQQQRARAHAAGKVPLLAKEHAMVLDMAAVFWDSEAADLFKSGTAEQTLVWIDEQTGVWCRAMLDWYDDGRIVDYKTTAWPPHPSVLPRKVADFGYHQQEAWYRDGVVALGLSDEPSFTFVFQEKTPPYLLAVVELDYPSLRVGEARNRRAREIYRDCSEAGIWPGYSTDVEVISLPGWALREEQW